MHVPYVDLALQHKPIRDELLNAVAEVIDSGQFILSDEVAEFERQFASLCGVKEAVAVNSGTDALILVLNALGIGPGDEVITAPNSFVASASCIALAGAKPVFADVREDFTIDPAEIEKAITAQTRAILPVHLTGQPAVMDKIQEIAASHGLAVIEDAAQSILAAYRGRPVGSLGDAGCFSLHPLKTLNACGDGGVITTDRSDIAENARERRNLGLRTRNDCAEWSSNSRLDAIQAAILNVKLKHLEEWTAQRKRNAGQYRGRLSGIESIQLPPEFPCRECVYHTFIIQAERRDELKAFLESKGIGSAIHYPTPIHLQTAAKSLGHSEGSFPVTERQSKRILSLPIHQNLTEDQIDHVAEAIRKFYS